MRARVWIPLWAILTVAALAAGYLVQLYQLLVGQDTGLTYADVFIALLAGAWWLRVSRRPFHAAVACGLAALASMVVAGLLVPLTARWLASLPPQIQWGPRLIGSVALGALALVLETAAMGFMGAWLASRIAGVWPGAIRPTPEAISRSSGADATARAATDEAPLHVAPKEQQPARTTQQSALLDWIFPLFAALWAAPSGLALLPTLIPVTMIGARVTQPAWVTPTVQGLHVLALVVTALLAGIIAQRAVTPLAVARTAALGAGFGRLVVGADLIWRLYAPLFTTRGAADFQDQGVALPLAIAGRAVEQIAATVLIALAAMGAALLGAWLFTSAWRFTAEFTDIWPVTTAETAMLAWATASAAVEPMATEAVATDGANRDDSGDDVAQSSKDERDDEAQGGETERQVSGSLRWIGALAIFLIAIGVRLGLNQAVLHGSWPSSALVSITDAVIFVLAGLIVTLLANSLVTAISFGLLTGLILPGIAIATALSGLVQRGALHNVAATSLEIYILSIVVGLITIASTFVSWYALGGALAFGTPLRRFALGVAPAVPVSAEAPADAQTTVSADAGKQAGNS
jgi:hypothetical protein